MQKLSSLRRLIASRRTLAKATKEQGYALVFVTFLLLPMLGMVGLAVDVGSFYVRAAQIQRAADAAALAGVVHQPDFATAEATARDYARRNGFDPAVDPKIEVVVESIGNQRLRVTIYDRDVDVFFSSVFLSDVEIVRYSTAEYVRPVPLGSPINSFGNTSAVPGASDPQFWAAIQAPFTRYVDGDPFSTSCLTTPDIFGTAVGESCSGGVGTQNPDFRPEGYWFAVEISPDQVNVPVTISVFDAGFYQRASLSDSAGDYVFNDASGRKPDTGFQLYDTDDTVLDYSDNPPISSCNLQVEAETGGYKDIWAPICVITPSRPGLFPIRVYTANSPNPRFAVSNFPTGWDSEGQGFNGFSLRATCTGCPTQPRLYGLTDISILNNIESVGVATSEFYLAEIAAENTGKTLEVRMFDPGDGEAGTFRLSMIHPNGSPQQGCSYVSDGGSGGAPLSGTITGDCTVITRNGGAAAGSENLFDGQWLTITVPLSAYTCADGVTLNGCWWKVNYEFVGGAQATDRTVWQVRVIGDPVRLVPG